MAARRGGTLRVIQVRGRCVELAKLCEGEREPSARRDEGDPGLWAFGLTPRALERLDVLLEDGLGLPIVPLRVVAVPEVATRERLKRGVPDAVTNPQTPFAVLDGELGLALEVVVVDEVGVDARQTLIVPKLLRRRLGLAR
jgi:hypothetical protein